MDSNFGYYIFMLVVLVVGIIAVKKVTTCLIKTIIGVIVIAILAAIYYSFAA